MGTLVNTCKSISHAYLVILRHTRYDRYRAVMSDDKANSPLDNLCLCFEQATVQGSMFMIRYYVCIVFIALFPWLTIQFCLVTVEWEGLVHFQVGSMSAYVHIGVPDWKNTFAHVFLAVNNKQYVSTLQTFRTSELGQKVLEMDSSPTSVYLGRH